MIKKTKLLIFKPYNFLYEPFWNISFIIIINITKNYVKKNENLTKKSKSKTMKEKVKFFCFSYKIFL